MSAPNGNPAPAGRRPLVAITLGDPFGIGPELVVRLLSDRAAGGDADVVVIGDPDVARENVRRLGARLRVVELGALEEAAFARDLIEVLVPAGERVGTIDWGRVDARAGGASLAAFGLAADLIRERRVDALLSAPVNKQALKLAGMAQADELLHLAALTGGGEPAVIGVLESLLTICVTLHVPLREVPALVTRERVASTARLLRSLLRAEAAAPRLVVAGLNPHAGDGGTLGREELDEIIPALEDLRAEGTDVIGPLAPDVAFPQAIAQRAHGVVCMYHDQANIARKLFGFSGATLFVGLPVPVATTAHGVAFDRAGAGTADPTSLRLAFEQLVRLAEASA